MTVFPLVFFISKTQFFSLFYNEDEEVPNKYLNIFNVVISLLCVAI